MLLPLEVGEPDLDERPDPLLEPRLARRLERLLVTLPHLGRVDPLLEPVVSGHEQLLDPQACVFPLHKLSVTRQIYVTNCTETPW